MDRQTLVSEIFRKKSFLCVGLDTDPARLPGHLQGLPDAVFQFNCQIIDATRDLCVAYKPNLAFYEARGAAGWRDFERTVAYIGDRHFIIADAKRGDIGNTSRMYAEAFFENTHCDAVTVAPYMGADSVSPFLGFPGKWAIVLALTSNPGSADFQRNRLEDSRELLWERVVARSQAWGTPDNLMFVVGATHPEANAAGNGAKFVKIEPRSTVKIFFANCAFCHQRHWSFR
ncbi:MAG: orotidine-5'-phosphate decarboxylase [Lewinellaceae bacterium]|nr:orotidine-5'-phosphate decarboxylase [Lewinellaceae bacterium]